MTQETTAEESTALGYETEPEEDWFEDEHEETPPRPRRKLLAPLPVTLLVVLLTACGFLAGVEVEKNHSSSSSASGGLPSGFAALRSRATAAAGGTAATGSGSTGTAAGGSSPGAGTGTAAGFPGGGFAAGGSTTGEVSYVSGNTLYVADAEGNTVKITAPTGTTVSKTVSTSVAGVHPGDTVVVKGSQSKSGSVTASSISISSSSGSGSSSNSNSSSSATGSGTTQQLFGSG
jgi:hypothetical protein